MDTASYSKWWNEKNNKNRIRECVPSIVHFLFTSYMVLTVHKHTNQSS